ncbi:MAG TPA: hypothetical protein VJM34_02745, partial [Novosphingobium sp.]|nr:hypothetical protein [Novosphingobium sp.]
MVNRTTGATSQTWDWYNTGLLRQSVGLNGTEDYGYDRTGDRTSEKLVQGGQTIKDATATYDALGRLTGFTQAGASYANGSGSYASPSMANTYAYDAMGNVRSTVSTHAMLDAQGAASGSTVTDTYWYRYDSMNRLVLDKGVLSGAAGAAGTTIVRGTAAIRGLIFGQEIVYNAAGERVQVIRTDYRPFDPGDPINGVPLQLQSWQEVRELYAYKGDGSLSQITQTMGAQVSSASAVASNPAASTGGTVRSALTYDVMGRLTGQTDYDDAGVAMHNRTSSFNAIGQVTSSSEYTIRWNATRNAKLTYSSTSSYSYANAGQYYLGVVYRITGTSGVTGSSTRNTSTTNTYAWFDGAVQSQIVYDDDTSSPGSFYTTTFTNDAFGQTTAASVNDGRARTVSYKLGGDGQILRRDEQDSDGSTGDPHEVWYRFNGREMAYIGNDGTDNASTQESIYDQIQPINTGAFRNGQQYSYAYADTSGGSYEALNAYSQGSVAGTYQVQTTGESLRSIALQIWGDASLWYKLAEANGLDANTTLIEGQRLTLPAGVVRSSFNAETLRPYDAADAMGNVSPTTPKPKKAKCGAFGQMLLVAVAVAVAAIIAPPLIGSSAGVIGTTSVGIVGTGATLAVPVIGATGLTATLGAAGAAIAGGALAGAAGSIVSQGVGVATSIQSKFSFGAVAMAAIGAGVGGAIGGIGPAGFVGDVLRGAAGSAIAQGIGVATGLQKRFSWTGIAAAGIGNAVGDFTASRAGPIGGFGSDVTSSTASVMANAATRSALSGTSFGDNLMRALPDALGGLAGRALGGAANAAIARAQANARQAAGTPVEGGQGTVGARV